MQTKATVFEFISYIFEPDKKRILFNYKTVFSGGSSLFFTETILLPSILNLSHVPPQLLKKLLESLHVMLGISYYKFYCATKVALPYALSKQEADFWNTVYKKGLGEFFYQNHLDPKISPIFPYNKNSTPKPITYKLSDRSLVAIGGGKDSIVSAELLKEYGFDITAFSVHTNDSNLIDEIIQKIGLKNLKIRRLLDEKVHQEHRYNGHIPISAIYAFLGIFSATIYNYSKVIVSNEHSSNFGNIKYKGLEINHQWSKSLEFETLFGQYVKDVITPDVTYFSLLRPFYEIRIVKIFARYKKYFPHFSSCNNNFKFMKEDGGLWPANRSLGGGWCGHCPKCVFVFTLLSAYVSKKELVSIFGKNLYEEKNLLPLFNDILGFGNMKPFDCVGTFQEAQTALFLAKKKFAKTFIVRHLGEKAKYYQEVFSTNQSRVPEPFKFLGMENALILGYGKEGNVSKKYLEKEYPKLKVGIAAASQGKNYLNKQKDFDIAIKTPGIKKELVKIPYTTATNIFFAAIKGKYPIIGVTGSKGKSTTASLIFAMLKAASKNTVLAGNIGTPMLSCLLKPIKKGTIFVLELSSYQLDDIAYSPDIAVVTNLFPEHMDFHGGLKSYYEAKKNIIRAQKSNDYFVYHKKITAWLKNYHGKAMPFSKTKYRHTLLGEHNEQNIGAAIAAVKILGVHDPAIKKALENFKGLAHRLEFVGEFKGITFYDDAISTTPESTIMAIKALKNVDTIFLGGEDRGYDFSQLEKIIKKYKIKNAVLFPESGDRINVKGLNLLKTKRMEKAVAFAYKHTKTGSVCLLSCASPSYSLWKNFEEKGDQFKKYVKKLGT
jgi:UDP-N-acetylmuramoylalanine-D-glutamate ligase